MWPTDGLVGYRLRAYRNAIETRTATTVTTLSLLFDTPPMRVRPLFPLSLMAISPIPYNLTHDRDDEIRGGSRSFLLSRAFLDDGQLKGFVSPDSHFSTLTFGRPV